jgi:hypothetical protein
MRFRERPVREAGPRGPLLGFTNWRAQPASLSLRLALAAVEALPRSAAAASVPRDSANASATEEIRRPGLILTVERKEDQR